MKFEIGILASILLCGGCALIQPQNQRQAASVPARQPALPDLETTPQPGPGQRHDTIAKAATDTAAANAEAVAAKTPPNIWDRVRAGFALPNVDNPRIDRELTWYAGHQAYLNRAVERAQPYMHYIVDQLDANNIPMEIALLPIVESAFRPFAYSRDRASGIWQFIPSTGRRFGLEQNWWYDGRRDLCASTRAAIKLLSALRDEFDGNWLLALAAYNAGDGSVQKAIRKNERRHNPTDFFSLDLPSETRSYVPKLLALKKLINNPHMYNVQLARIDDAPYFARIKLDSQIDLGLAADLADMDLDDLYELNPEYNRWATSPNGPNYLLIPLDNADEFKHNLAEYPADKRIKWIRHKIRRGETMSKIAVAYHTRIDIIKHVNHMHSNLLRAGHNLMIPVASKNLSSYTLSANQRKRSARNTPRREITRRIGYRVRRGDSLALISRKFHVTVAQLLRWNKKLDRDDYLQPGQQLRLFVDITPTPTGSS
jgi:membrane-bound lytic murein transglycosylase D